MPKILRCAVLFGALLGLVAPFALAQDKNSQDKSPGKKATKSDGSKGDGQIGDGQIGNGQHGNGQNGDGQHGDGQHGNKGDDGRRQDARHDALKENGIDPGPRRGKGSWAEFIRLHAATLWQCDFFTKKVWTLAGPVEFFILFFIQAGSRKVHIAGMTANPDRVWMAQQARNVATGPGPGVASGAVCQSGEARPASAVGRPPGPSRPSSSPVCGIHTMTILLP